MALTANEDSRRKRRLDESYIVLERLKKLRALNADPRLVGMDPRLFGVDGSALSSRVKRGRR